LALGGLGLVVAGVAIDIPLSFAIANAPALTPGADYGGSGGGAAGNLAFEVPMLLLAVLATVIVLRREGNLIGWLLLGAIVTLAVPVGDYGTYGIAVRHGALPGGALAVGLGDFLWAPMVALLLLLPLQLFPDGRPLSRRWRWLVWATVGVVVVGYLGNTFGPHGYAGGGFPHASTGVLGTVLGLAYPAFAVGGLCGGLGLVSLVIRYRRSTSEVRHQIRWLLFAGLLYIIPFATYISLLEAAHLNLEWIAAISVLGLGTVPFAMAIAVLKYRLYDIDIIISRTFVYVSLAALITGVYVGVAVGIGHLVGGGGKPNLGLSILATAIVAVGFQPARERLQRGANRLVYGRRASPYEVLSNFSQRVAGTYAAEDVLVRMARVLQEGTAAQTATVWLRHGERLRPAATHPISSDGQTDMQMTGDLLPAIPGTDRTIPVLHQGELLGALSVTKRRGESLNPIEAKLLEDLANQAGLMLKNVGLTSELFQRLEELRASRLRLVGAEDEARRRLERNLHDGAQQHLVAIKVKLGLAETLLERDPGKALATLTQLKSDADEALETLRDLARGIYPPLLADKGLVAAVESQARKATVPVTVEAGVIDRHAQDIEAAVYFCILEAIQNVQKYAGRCQVVVRLDQSGGRLLFEVEDDGCGFDPATAHRGAGLTNMEDRLEALGGGLNVDSSLGRGGHVRGWVPLQADAAG